jgi:hypothetical protein
MTNKEDIHENGSDSKLKGHFGNANPFEVPEGYFESQPDRIMDKVREIKGKKIYLQPRIRNLAAAAVILILVTIGSVFLFNGQEDIDESLPDISMSDLYMYNINSLAELEESYLLSLINSDSLDLQVFMAPDTSDINDDIIREYLLAENHIEYLLLNEY